MNTYYQPSTICAVATPAGVGGIAIIRLSGVQSLEIVDKLFRSYRGGKALSSYPLRQAVYERLRKRANSLTKSSLCAMLRHTPTRAKMS